MVQLAIAFAPTTHDDSPNIKVSQTSDGLSVYYRSMSVAFASVRRSNPEIELKLISTENVPPPFVSIFRGLGVNVELVAFDHRPPVGFYEKFSASLYLLDALQTIDRPTLFIDPDVLCVGSLSRMAKSLAGRTGVLCLNTKPTDSINGISLAEISRIAERLGFKPSVRHCGGEFLYLEPPRSSMFIDDLETCWQDALQLHEANQPHPNTEEHLISCVATSHDVFDARSYISRIWTARSHRVVEIGPETVLWHLPAEKQRGISELFAMIEPDGTFLRGTSDAELKTCVARACGVYNRRIGRLILDAVGRMSHLVRRR